LLLEKAQTLELEVICNRKDGTQFRVKISKNTIPNSDGTYTSSLFLVQDISRLKKEILQKKLLSDINQLFSNDESLPKALNLLMKHLVNLGKLEMSEIWLLNADSTALNMAAYHASRSDLEKFYSGSPLNFKKGEGLPG